MLNKANVSYVNKIVAAVLLGVGIASAASLVAVGQSGGMATVLFVAVGAIGTAAALTSLELGLMALIFVAAIANIWLQMPALMLTVSTLAVLIFSAFILVDVQRIIRGGETNYVTATLSIYLSVYNIFSNLLVLLGVFGGED